MSAKKFLFEGNIPALVTPFTDAGELMTDSLAALVEWQLTRGADGICLAGDNGEAWALTHDDRKRLAETAVKAVRKRVPVLMGASYPVPRQTIDRLMTRGEKLYTEHCADCHGENGAGRPPAYPPLAGNRALTMRSAVNAIRMVLNGGFAPGTSGNPRPYGMPPFRPLLNDEEVAAVVSYIRNSWGNHAGPVSPVEVDRYRSIPAD